MKVLVVLEHHFVQDLNGTVWCDRVVDRKFLQRYLDVYEEVIICARMKKINTVPKDMLLASGERIKFVALPEFIGIKGLIVNYINIIKIVKKEAKKVNCVILRGPSHLSLILYKIIYRLRKPFAVEFMMAADRMVDSDSIFGRLINKYIDNQAKDMCLKANGVAYVTENLLQLSYPCKAIKTGINSKYFTSSYSSIDLHEEYYFNQRWKPIDKPKEFIISHTGYMDSSRKGQDILLKATKIVLDRGYKIKTIFIGDGPQRIHFENLATELNIEEQVEFLGAINDKKELFEVLKKSHLFVLPTQSEGLPRSIIEAMAVGLPCISTMVDGVPELVDKEYLLNFKDYKGFAEKIINLINDWEQMIEISEKNYVKSQKYNYNVLKQKRLRFYSDLKNVSEI